MSEEKSIRLPAIVRGKKPSYANKYAAGLDLPYFGEETLVIQPGDHITVHTGLSLELPPGYFGLVVIRSGLGSKGLMLANGVGIIDEDYRGEIRMPLFHHGDQTLSIMPGERIAQMVVTPYVQVQLEEVDRLEESARGLDGFGSSGRF